MNHAGDRIITFISKGETGSVRVMSRSEFLAQFPDTWKEMLQSGLSMYIGTNGQMLAFDEAKQHLQNLVC
ncbi:MAG: hypothetical protein ACAI44_01695 [Candidatus Sericytochromatia bacterium]